MRQFMLVALLSTVAFLVGCQTTSRQQLDQQAIDHYVQGQMLASQGSTEAALAELAKAIQLDGGLATAHSAMGDIYRKQQSYDLAARAYERAVQVNPYNFRNHYNLGVLRQTLANAAGSIGEVKKQLYLAVEVYLRAITLRPDDYDANINLGVCYYQLGQLDKAEQYCKAAIALKEDKSPGHTNLGAVYDGQGKFYEAIACYKKSLELDTRQPRVVMNLGTTYVKLGQYKSALHAYQMVADMDPKSAVPLERLAYCHYYLEEYDKSVEVYQAALAINPRFADARRGLGVVYMTQYVRDTTRKELSDKALGEWNASLEINPNQPELAKLVQKYTPKSQVPGL